MTKDFEFVDELNFLSSNEIFNDQELNPILVEIPKSTEIRPSSTEIPLRTTTDCHSQCCCKYKTYFLIFKNKLRGFFQKVMKLIYLQLPVEKILILLKKKLKKSTYS